MTLTLLNGSLQRERTSFTALMCLCRVEDDVTAVTQAFLWQSAKESHLHWRAATENEIELSCTMKWKHSLKEIFHRQVWWQIMLLPSFSLTICPDSRCPLTCLKISKQSKRHATHSLLFSSLRQNVFNVLNWLPIKSIRHHIHLFQRWWSIESSSVIWIMEQVFGIFRKREINYGKLKFSELLITSCWKGSKSTCECCSIRYCPVGISYLWPKGREQKKMSSRLNISIHTTSVPKETLSWKRVDLRGLLRTITWQSSDLFWWRLQ